MYINAEQTQLYTWYQSSGWSGSSDGSKLFKYDITGAKATLIDSYIPVDYKDFTCSPINSPILINGDKLIIKQNEFDSSTLDSIPNKYPETIYAIDKIRGYAVGYNGIYDLNTGVLLQPVDLNGSNYIVYNRDGNLYFSKNNFLQKYELTAINVESYHPEMLVGETKQISVSGTYTDGKTIDVTSKCTFSSSDPEVSTVNESGLITAVGNGTAKITITCGEFTASIDLKVEIDVSSISVEGYDIGFTTAKTYYMITLPTGTTNIPAVTYKADENLVVTVENATSLPGTTLIIVKDKDGIYSKSYLITFTIMPIILTGEIGILGDSTLTPDFGKITPQIPNDKYNYYWTIDGLEAGERNAPYVVQENDAGKQIVLNVELNDPNYQFDTIKTATFIPMVSKEWSDYADEVWGNDYDTEDTFRISTPEQLAKFANMVNVGLDFAGKTVYLANDINLNSVHPIELIDGTLVNAQDLMQWTEGIGTDSPFSGTFDGYRHAVIGMYTTGYHESYGLFDYVGENGIVKNVSLKNGYINAISPYFIGGIAALNSGIVEGCNNATTIESEATCIGGVVGANDGSVIDCCNTGEVIGASDACGGVAGASMGSMSGCYNEGKVIGCEAWTGGVTGSNISTMINCYNKGTVGGESDFNGGVVGDQSGYLFGCYNLGEVTTEDACAGGIAGNCQGEIVACYNLGSVSGKWGDYAIGGIVGYNYEMNLKFEDSTIIGCYNAGILDQNAYFKGGIVGYYEVTPGIFNACYYDTDKSGFAGVRNGNVVGATRVSGARGFTDDVINAMNTAAAAVVDIPYHFEEDSSIDPKNGGYPMLSNGKKLISTCTAVMNQDQIYSPNGVDLSNVVKDGDLILKQDVDYTITYLGDGNVGDGTAVITGIGEYSGTINIAVKISPIVLTGELGILGNLNLTPDFSKLTPQIPINKFDYCWTIDGMAVGERNIPYVVQNKDKGKQIILNVELNDSNYQFDTIKTATFVPEDINLWKFTSINDSAGMVRVNVVNQFNDYSQFPTVILAAFDENGKLLKVETKNIEPEVFEYDFDMTASMGVSYYKAFLWKDISSLAPVGKSLKYNVE